MENKDEKIMSLLRIKGPVVPGQISSEIGLEPLFISAMLSELVSKKRLLISHLKVGSSPLYYLPEQKSYLENYEKNLNNKEREAFLLLKENKILEDSGMEPAIRVAMRSIKDFAIPMKVSQNNKEIIFWRFYSITNEDAVPRIKEMLKKIEIEPVKKEIAKEKEAEIKKEPVEIKIERMAKSAEKRREKQKITDVEKEKFIEKIKSFTYGNNIEIISEIKIRKKDERQMIVSLDSSIGKLDYLLIAKNKENISSKDLMEAYKKGKRVKMPVLFLTNGNITSSAEKYGKSLKGHLIVRRLSP